VEGSVIETFAGGARALTERGEKGRIKADDGVQHSHNSHLKDQIKTM
jgi:hypothetical protein